MITSSPTLEAGLINAMAPDIKSVPAALAPLALGLVPVAGRIGAEVRGLVLTGAMPKSVIAALTRALLNHKVLFFRGQHHLDDVQHQAFARQFGALVEHPPVHSRGSQVLELDSHRGGRANSWHTDVTFEMVHPKISVLRTVQVPDRGGDTVRANTVAALQELPVPMQRFLETLWAVHGNDFDCAATRVELDDEGAKKYRKLYAANVTKTEHPVVRVHPERANEVWCSATTRSALWVTTRRTRTTSLRYCKVTSRGWKTPCAGTGHPATWRSGTTAPPSTARSTTTATRIGWRAV